MSYWTLGFLVEISDFQGLVRGVLGQGSGTTEVQDVPLDRVHEGGSWPKFKRRVLRSGHKLLGWIKGFVGGHEEACWLPLAASRPAASLPIIP